MSTGDAMRDIIGIVGHYVAGASAPLDEGFAEQASALPVEGLEGGVQPLMADLRDLCFKLRGHSENEPGERALGVEDGMQRAADMIDNLLRRHEDG